MTAYYVIDNDNALVGTGVAQRDPRDPSNILYPVDAVLAAPPAFDQFEVPVWDGSVWSVSPDYRGVTYWIGQEEFVQNTLGPLPEGASLTQPDLTLEERRAAASVTFAELVEGLLRIDKVHPTEVLAWTKSGTLPATVDSLVGSMPLNGRENIKMRIQVERELRFGTFYPRNSASISVIASALNLTENQLDNFFGV